MHNLQSVSAPSVIPGERPKPVSGWEYVAAVLILLVFSEGLLPRLVSGEAVAEGSPLLRFIWLPLYAIIFVGLLSQAGAVARTCLRLPFLIGLLVVCTASFAWSIDPGLTQRRSLAIVMTTGAGLYLGTRYRWQDLLRILGAAWLIVALASFFTGLLLPGFGREQEIHPGAWSGLYFEKNQMGGHMARAALIAVFLWIMDRRMRWLWASTAVLCAVLVLLSISKTALLGLIIGLGVLGIGALMKRGFRTGLVTLWIGAGIAGLGAATVWLAPEIVFALLGRDASLTGRTDIWITLMDFIEQRPVLGYGYGSFWAIDSDPGNWVRATLQWDAPTAHNGWLEITLALGMVGLVLLALDFLLTLGRAVLASVTTWTGLFALAFVAQFFVFSLSESASFQQNSIVWLIYVAVAAKLTTRPRNGVAVRPAQPAPWRPEPGFAASAPLS